MVVVRQLFLVFELHFYSSDFFLIFFLAVSKSGVYINGVVLVMICLFCMPVFFKASRNQFIHVSISFRGSFSFRSCFGAVFNDTCMKMTLGMNLPDTKKGVRLAV